MALITIHLNGGNYYRFECKDAPELLGRFVNETLVDIPYSQRGERVLICKYGVSWIEVEDQPRSDNPHDNAGVSSQDTPRR